LLSVKTKGRNKTFNWYVSNPINNYGVNINIGRLRFLLGKIQREKGDLDCYYVLRDNLAKSQEQFKDVPRMLKAFEWFGPYPFYEDSYKLVKLLIWDGTSKFSYLWKWL
jgi:hypothetical protein